MYFQFGSLLMSRVFVEFDVLWMNIGAGWLTANLCLDLRQLKSIAIQISSRECSRDFFRARPSLSKKSTALQAAWDFLLMARVRLILKH